MSQAFSRLAAGVGLAAVATLSFASEPVSGGPEAIRLHIVPDGSSATFRLGATTQALTPTTRCEIAGAALDGPLIKLTSSRKVGMSSNSIGVKTGGSQGTPCGRSDATETLALTTKGTSGLNGRLMHRLVLDLELKGNAWVRLTLTHDGAQIGPVFELQTGSSIQPDATPATGGPPYMATSTAAAPKAACANPSDSGPDSGPNDNCLWTVDPGADFDTATFTTMVGEFSLEGSGDYGGDPAYDTLLYLSNRAPVAVDDVLSTPEDTPLSVNVLGNDADADGDPIAVVAVNAAAIPASIALAGGTATLAANGALTFTPNLNFNGPAGSFTYTIADGEGATATATVSIAVTAVNDPPVATGSSPEVAEDASVIVPIATDVEDDLLTVTCDDPAKGSVDDNGDGSITYTPDADFNGPDSFDCTASDGTSTSNEVTISVTVRPVNDPPVATDDTAETDENFEVVVDVLANDEDIDGDALTVTAVADPDNGSAVISNGGADVTYTPDPDHTGPDSFEYQVSDGNGGSDTATVTVETFQTICSEQSVTVFEGDVTGTFTRLTDPEQCKRYVAEADELAGTVLFQPEGSAQVKYRGVLQLGSAPPLSPVSLSLEYDPSGGDDFQPVQWCIAPVFNPSGEVTSAMLPAGETWCIASAYTAPTAPPDGIDLVTVWQVYGEDDPKFR